MRLKLALCTFAVLFGFVESAQAVYMSALFGPKSESYESSTQQRTRINPVSLLLNLDFKLRPGWYLSIGTSGEFDFGDFATKGFTLSVFTKYFIVGVPDLIKTAGKDARLELALPYTVFAGLGLFQKNIKFADDPNLIHVDTSVGGLGVNLGGSYNLSKRYFVISQLQYLVSGLSSDETYTSMEFYAGLGYRF